MKTLTGVSLASDAFFPFRDSIDVASTRGVSYVVAAGGSVQICLPAYLWLPYLPASSFDWLQTPPPPPLQPEI